MGCAQPAAGPRQVHLLFGVFDQAQIGDFRHTISCQEDVVRLDVAMDDALRVRPADRVADLAEDGHEIGDSESQVGWFAALPAPERLAERDPDDAPHREIGAAIGMALEVEDRDDVRMFDLGVDTRFAHQPVNRIPAGQDVLLQRNLAVEAAVEGLQHTPGAAPAELADDGVARADVLSGRELPQPAGLGEGR